MKPTELMINNWVIGKKWREKPFQITRINDSGKFIFGKTGDSTVGPFFVEEIEPITLTLEILERNGFELRDDFLYHRIDDKPHHYDFKLKNGGVFSEEGFMLNCGIYYLTIRYVHELQNALRLCGLNDLADNLKVEE